MSIDTARTSDDIARDIDALRQRMDTTLDAIEDRLRPAAWVRHGLGALALKDKGRYLLLLATLVRRHPVPAIAIGVAAVAVGVLRQRHVESKVEKENASLQRLSRAIDAAKGAIRSTGSAIRRH